MTEHYTTGLIINDHTFTATAHACNQTITLTLCILNCAYAHHTITQLPWQAIVRGGLLRKKLPAIKATAQEDAENRRARALAAAEAKAAAEAAAAAEAKRIADARLAELKRIADEQAAELKRIADAKAAEEKRIADELAAAEAQRRAEEQAAADAIARAEQDRLDAIARERAASEARAAEAARLQALHDERERLKREAIEEKERKRQELADRNAAMAMAAAAREAEKWRREQDAIAEKAAADDRARLRVEQAAAEALRRAVCVLICIQYLPLTVYMCACIIVASIAALAVTHRRAVQMRAYAIQRC
jgi:hypothetical protein